LDDGKGKAESSFVEEGKDCEKGNALGGGRRRNGVHNLKCNFGIRSDIAHAKTCRHAADDLAIGIPLDINRSGLQYERHISTSTMTVLLVETRSSSSVYGKSSQPIPSYRI
jgi:hypothetical protein